MSAYNTGSNNNSTNTTATASRIVQSATVSVDDLLFVFGTFFTYAGSNITDITCVADSGHTWTKVGPMLTVPDFDGFSQHSVVYSRKATSGDAGDGLSLKAVGSAGSTDVLYWATITAAYTGFPGGVDVHNEHEETVPPSQGHVAYPTATTTEDGDWVLYFGLGAINGSGDATVGPSGTTVRQHNNNSGITAILSDSNGSVGNSGTVVGGVNQTYAGGGSPDVWAVLHTIAISPNASAITGTGSIRMHKMGLSGSGHAPVIGTGSIRMHKMGINIQGRLPGVGNIHMHKMQISGTGNAPLRGTGSIRMHKMGISASGNVADLGVVFVNTTSGVDNYTVTSSMNGPGTTTLRVLRPTSPAAGYSPAFIYTLAVEANGGTTFGNGLDHINSLGAHNAYNLTVVEPSFKLDPWFADSDIDSDRHYQSFMVALRKWTQANLGATGLEQHILIGFSKSGIGGQTLILNNPTTWDKCISWDFPTNGDIPSRFTGNADLNYGTDANFLAHYQLDNTALAAKKGPFLTKNRLYIADGTSFDTDVSDYAGRLTSNSLLHTYPTPVTRTHAWGSGWVAPALASVMVQQVSGFGSIRMHKMGASAAGHAPLVGLGSIRMHKMSLASSGTVGVKGTGSIRMHKMRIKTPDFIKVHASEIFVFSDV